MKKQLIQKSKFISLVLRHKPEAADLQLDVHGWADISSLLQGAIRNGIDISREELQEIVDTNEKRRFVICGETDRIRANQGHSLEIDLQLKPATPPPVLYHGTTIRFENAIFAQGLKKMKRHHVHLSSNLETARMVGARHGELLVLEIYTAPMLHDGHSFYCSENGVWLTDSIPPQYIKKYIP